jgi:hypothetical protein
MWWLEFLDEASIGAWRKGDGGGRSSGRDWRGREYSFYRGRGEEANGPRDLSGLFLFLSWLDEPFFFLRVEPSLWPTGLARPVRVSSSTPDQEQSNRKDIFPNDFKPNRS